MAQLNRSSPCQIFLVPGMSCRLLGWAPTSRPRSITNCLICGALPLVILKIFRWPCATSRVSRSLISSAGKIAVAGVSGCSCARRDRSATRTAVIASKARHLHRSSTVFSLRSLIRVPGLRVLNQVSMVQRLRYQVRTRAAWTPSHLPSSGRSVVRSSRGADLSPCRSDLSGDQSRWLKRRTGTMVPRPWHPVAGPAGSLQPESQGGHRAPCARVGRRLPELSMG